MLGEDTGRYFTRDDLTWWLLLVQQKSEQNELSQQEVNFFYFSG